MLLNYIWIYSYLLIYLIIVFTTVQLFRCCNKSVKKLIKNDFFSSKLMHLIKISSVTVRKSSSPTSGPSPTFHFFSFYLVMGKTVAPQLQDHLKYNDLFEELQSNICPGFSTETALVRVTNDLLITAETGSLSLLILDLTTAFDTVNQYALLHCLQYTIGLSEKHTQRFTSYLTDRTENVALGQEKSLRCPSRFCVVLSFTVNPLPLGNLISRY